MLCAVADLTSDWDLHRLAVTHAPTSLYARPLDSTTTDTALGTGAETSVVQATKERVEKDEEEEEDQKGVTASSLERVLQRRVAVAVAYRDEATYHRAALRASGVVQDESAATTTTKGSRLSTPVSRFIFPECVVADVDNVYRMDSTRPSSTPTATALPDLSPKLSFPRLTSSFIIGCRVDALDSKGYWYAGNVMDVWKVTQSELQETDLLRPLRMFELQDSAGKVSNASGSIFVTDRVGVGTGVGGSAALVHAKAATLGTPSPERLALSSSQTAKPTNSREEDSVIVSVPTTNGGSAYKRKITSPGTLIRVHFDGFSHTWDEWYTQSDVDKGWC